MIDIELEIVAGLMEQGESPSMASESLWCFANLSPSEFHSSNARELFVACSSLQGKGGTWTHIDVFEHMGGNVRARESVERAMAQTSGLAPVIAIRAGVCALVKENNRRKIALELETASKHHNPAELLPELRAIDVPTPFSKPRGAGHLLHDHLKLVLSQDGSFPTKIQPIDRLFRGGFRQGELVIIGARPGTGKTALMLQMALNAINYKRRFLFVTLEMGAGALLARMGSSVVGANLEDMGSVKGLGPEAQQRGEDFIVALEASGSEFVTNATTVGKIGAAIGKDGPFDAVFVDYLQLLGDPKYAKQGRTQEVSAISRDLKVMAMGHNVPVICACQLNRLSESRDDKRPRLSDLRESGSIEQDADSVLLLHDPAAKFKEQGMKANGEAPPRDQLTCIIAKNRRGPTDLMQLRFDKETQRIAAWEIAM